MIYLSGAIDRRLIRPGFGFMLGPATGNRVPPGVPWAADNGAFSGKWTLEAQLRFLARHARAKAACLFAVLPDVVDDPRSTQRNSYAAIGAIGATGYPLAYVLQPGVTSSQIPWSDIGTVFVGGSDARFKFEDATLSLIDEAHDRGKLAHCGRVNTFRRIRHARLAGYDSVDGTTALFKARYLSLLPKWLAITEAQAPMALRA